MPDVSPPTPWHGLTEAQRRVVQRTLEGAGRSQIARELGISEGTVRHYLTSHSVLFAIRAEVNRRLLVDSAPLALRVLQDLARSENTPPAVRRLAASDLLRLAGFVPPKASDRSIDDREKEPSEMKTEELHQYVAKLEAELAARAREVTGDSAPDAPPGDVKPMDFLD